MSSVGKAVGKIFNGPLDLFGGGGGGDTIIQAPPALPSPPPMPIPDDKAVKDAQKRSVLRQRRRSGRSSTILSDPTEGDTLG